MLSLQVFKVIEDCWRLALVKSGPFADLESSLVRGKAVGQLLTSRPPFKHDCYCPVSLMPSLPQNFPHQNSPRYPCSFGPHGPCSSSCTTSACSCGNGHPCIHTENARQVVAWGDEQYGVSGGGFLLQLLPLSPDDPVRWG